MRHISSPLRDLVEHFVSSLTWVEAQQAVSLHPELLTDDSAAVFEDLIVEARSQGKQYTVEFYEENLAFLNRLRYESVDPAALDAMESEGEVSPELQQMLVGVKAAVKRFETEGSSEAATISLAAWESVINHPRFSTSPKVVRQRLFDEAGCHLYACYLQTDDGRYALHALALFQQGLMVTSVKSPRRARFLSNSGRVIAELYKQTQDQEHLLKAIAFYSQAVDQYLAPDINLIAESLTDLAKAWRDRFRVTRNANDLAEMLNAFQRAVDKTQGNSGELADRVDDLARAYRISFSLTKESKDLERALALYQAAVQISGLTAEILAENIQGQGLCSFLLFMERGEIRYLNQAVDRYLESSASAVETIAKADSLRMLSQCLEQRYGITGEVGDLKLLADAIRERIELKFQEDDPAELYESLGNALNNLHVITGDWSYATDSVEAWRQAARLTTTSSLDLAQLLERIIAVLSLRYRRFTTAEDLELIGEYKHLFAGLSQELKHEYLKDFVGQLVRTTLFGELHSLFTRHPGLLDLASDQILISMMDSAQAQGKAFELRALQRSRELLERCREKGIDQTFSEDAQVEGFTRQILEAIRARAESMSGAQREELMEAMEDADAVADLKDSIRKHGAKTVSFDEVLNALFTHRFPTKEIMEEYKRAEETRKRYYVRNDEEALVEAVHIWSRILALPDFSRLMRTFRLNVLTYAGQDFRGLYDLTERPEDLDTGIALMQQTIDMMRSDEEGRAVLLNTLGIALRARFKLGGDPGDLTRAIGFYDKVLELKPNRALHGMVLSNLGRALTSRYEATNDLTDLERAVPVLQQAVELTEDGDLAGEGLRLIKLGIASRYLYERTGEIAYLDQTIDCYERGHRAIPREEWARFPSAHSIGLDLLTRYEERGELQDLERAIDFWRHMISLPDVDPKDRVEFLRGLGQALEKLHIRTGEPTIQESSLAAFQQAVNESEPGSLEEAGALNGLSTALRHRYELTGNRADLDEALKLSSRAVELASRDRIKWAKYLSGLGILLMDRYDVESGQADLEAAINAWEQAVEIIPPTSSDWTTMQLNLASGLRSRYRLTSSLTDLTRMVEAYERALKGTRENAPDRGLFLTNMANALRDRYVRTGDLSDLEQAIEYCRQALNKDRIPDGDHTLFTNVAAALLQRYDILGELSDLEEAIEVCRRCIEVAPKNSRMFVAGLANLGTALMERYKHTRDESDLDDAISSLDQAIEGAPEGSRQTLLFKHNLGMALLSRFERTKALADLHEARRLTEDTLALLSTDSVHWPGIMHNLGLVMNESYKLNGDLNDRDRAIECHRQVCEHGLNQNWHAVIYSCNSWLRLAVKHESWEDVVEIYGYGLQAIEHLFRTQLFRADRNVWLQELNELPSVVAYAFTQLGKPIDAVLALETGRARLLADSRERARADLKMLPERGYGELYERYQAAATRLSELEKVELLQDGRMQDEIIVSDLRSARRDLEKAIAEIQQIPGYENFFRHQSWAQIQRTLTTRASKTSDRMAGVYVSVSSAGSLALIVHNGGVEPVWLPLEHDTLRDLLVDEEDGFIVSQNDVKRFKQSLDRVLPVIGEKVMKPIDEALRRLWPGVSSHEKACVTIIPGGLLALLPLHAASYAKNDAEKIFLDEFNTSYTPSARVLAAPGSVATFSEKTLFGVGNPLPLPAGYRELPFAGVEIKEIERFFEQGSEVLFETEATRETILKKLGTAKYMHFSCHGYFNVDNPLASGLVLSDGEWLTLSDLFMRSDLSATRMTVLSACQTAVTDYGPLREEAVGLASGFLHAGVPGVIGSLWSVSDLSTTLLMLKFYEYHFQGNSNGDGPLPAAKALRLAQLWLRDVTDAELNETYRRLVTAAQEKRDAGSVNSDESSRHPAPRKDNERPFAHPFNWAAFVFYGA